MASFYHVRIYCETCVAYKYTTQDVIDNTWKPEACAGHTTRDFVIQNRGCQQIYDGCLLELYDDDSSHRVAIKAPATVAEDFVLSMPAADAAGFLVSDGAGNLSFTEALKVSGEDDAMLSVYSDQYVITKAGTDEAINAAIDTGALNILLTAGGTVDATITVDNNYTVLDGGGWGTHLDASGDQSFRVIDLNAADYCCVQGLRITGKAGGGDAFPLIYGSATTHARIEDNFLDSSDDTGLYLTSSPYALVRGNYIFDSDLYSIHIVGCGQSIITNNIIHDSNNIAIFSQTNSYGIICDNVLHLGNEIRMSSAWSMTNSNLHVDPSGTAFNIFANYQVACSNLAFNGTYGLISDGDVQAITGNLMSTMSVDGYRVQSGHDQILYSGNVSHNAGNGDADFNLVGGNDYVNITGNIAFSAAGRSEYAVQVVNGDYGVVVGLTSIAHDTGSITLDATSNHWVIGWNRLEAKPTWTAGTNNIILYNDTTNMINEYNCAAEFSAAIGVRDGLDVLRVINLEDTAGQSKGIHCQAGTDATDYCQVWQQYDGTQVAIIKGDGAVTLSSLQVNGKIANVASVDVLYCQVSTVNEGIQLYNTAHNDAGSTPFWLTGESTAGALKTVSVEGSGAGAFVVRTGSDELKGFGTPRMTIDAAGAATFAGNVGIRVAADINALRVAGNLYVDANTASNYAATFINDGDNANRYGLRVWAGADNGAGTNYIQTCYDGDGTFEGACQIVDGVLEWYTVSDERRKLEVRTTAISGRAIMGALKVKDWELERVPSVTHTGFIAQDLMAVVPEAVSKAPGDDDTLCIARGRLIPGLVKSEQESWEHHGLADTERAAMQAEIDELERQVVLLRAERS